MHRITKKGTPYYRVRYGKRERVFAKYKDAQAFLRRVQAGDNPQRTSVEHIATRWEVEHLPTLAHNTIRGYKAKLAMYILPELGGVRADDLTVAQISSWLDKVADTTSPATANSTLRTLRAMMRWGRSKGLCTTRVLDDVRSLAQNAPQPPRPLTPKQVQAVAAACSRMRDATLFQFAAYTGLRWSELRAVQWDDIDLANRVVHVRRAQASDRRGHLKDPKSGKQRPAVILLPAVKALEEWREHAPDVPLVFPNRAGGPLGASWRRTVLDQEARRALPGLQMHNLRDTYASLLIATGDVNVGELCLRMGHSSVQTTISRYGGLLDSKRPSFISKADELLAQMLD